MENSAYTFRYKYKIYCGPTVVDSIANLLSQNYLAVIKGTAHVYVETNYDREHILKIIGKGRGWRLQDIIILEDHSDARPNQL